MQYEVAKELFSDYRSKRCRLTVWAHCDANIGATAGMTDRADALAMLRQYKCALTDVTSGLVDGGHTGAPFAQDVEQLLGTAIEIAKRNALHTFVVIPKRWAVKRSFAWLEKCRRLWKNCERNSIRVCSLSL